MQIFDYLNKDGLLHLIRKIMGRDVDLTQAEYDALPESKNSDGKNYYIYDSDIAVTAEEVGFDGSASGSTAANSQRAFDELFAADKKTNESLENINSNLSKYNRDTDSYDIYEDGVLVGSLPCGFQKIVLYNAGVTPTGVTINNNGTGVTINSDNIQLKGGESYGGSADGNALFTKLIKLDSKSKIFVECNISAVEYDGRFYIGLATSDSASLPALAHSKHFSKLTTGAKTLEMDVSGITGDFYVCVGILCNVYNDDALVATVSKVTVE